MVVGYQDLGKLGKVQHTMSRYRRELDVDPQKSK